MAAVNAPGWPGIEPRWTSSAKVGVGTALGSASRVWFTLSHGIFNEMYYPRVDQAAVRDMGMIVTDGHGLFSEEKRHTRHEVARLAEGVPGYRLANTCLQGRYRIEKEIVADPRRDAVLQWTRFVPLQGRAEDYRLHVILASSLGNGGLHNTAWVGDYKGAPLLFARRDALALALGCSAGWLRRSVGFVGFSDGWQDLHANGAMSWTWTRAEDGNVALTGEIDPRAAAEGILLVVAFGTNDAEAGLRARGSIAQGFPAARARYVEEWQQWMQRLVQPDDDPESPDGRRLYLASASVMRTHEAKRFPGGLIASLSVPWGFARGEDDLGGYHLIWPRDLAEAAGGLIACGLHDDAMRVLRYLQVTQEADGHWPQNQWLDGRPYWGGIQMDETAFPILLADLARRRVPLEPAAVAELWPMCRSAAAYLLAAGPVTQQDRWEEDPGYSPFTLAVEIAALLAAADLADAAGESGPAGFIRDVADAWNEGIERWMYACGTELARTHGVEGYYVRVAPPEEAEAASLSAGFVPIKNRPPGDSSAPASQIVSPDALALVRFGLRAADDPRILDTVKVIDALLKVDTPFGPAWHRYNDDGYGEHEDGSPFDGTGTGRAWPLLTGERAHYELAAGRRAEAVRLAHAMERFANEGQLIPEQIWDAEEVPERELACGRPSGSAMPLVWAHAEYVKLRRSLRDGAVFDMPPQTVQRYVRGRTAARHGLWRFNQRCQAVRPGRLLRIMLPAPAVVHWSADSWAHAADVETRDSGLGLHFADLPTDRLPNGAGVLFTFRWKDDERWEGRDYSVFVRER